MLENAGIKEEEAVTAMLHSRGWILITDRTKIDEVTAKIMFEQLKATYNVVEDARQHIEDMS